MVYELSMVDEAYDVSVLYEVYERCIRCIYGV